MGRVQLISRVGNPVGSAAGGRRPLESGDPRVRRAGRCKEKGCEGKMASKRVYRGRGPLPPGGRTVLLGKVSRALKTRCSSRREANSAFWKVFLALRRSGGLPAPIPAVSGSLRGGFLKSAGPFRGSFSAFSWTRLLFCCNLRLRRLSFPCWPHDTGSRPFAGPWSRWFHMRLPARLFPAATRCLCGSF